MNNLKQIFIIAILLFSISLSAQNEEKESIITDRPDQTESAFLVPKGNLQIETGAQITSYGNSFVKNQIQYNTTLFRYGLFDFLELRLNAGFSAVNFQPYNNLMLPPLDNYAGLEPIFVGLKIPLIKENGIIPQVAFMGHLTLPIASNEFKPDKVLPDFRFNFENTISERFSLGYNLGMEWYDASHSFLYTVALGVEITNKLGAFIEPFGYFYTSHIKSFSMDEHYINGGLTYLIKNNIQLDVYAGTAFTHKEYFGGIGFSIRIPD